MLSKQHGGLNTAITLFHQSNQRNVLTWNSLIRTFARDGDHQHVVLYLFQQMQQHAVLPNRVTYICSLSALVEPLSDISHGKRFHACLQASTFGSHVVTRTAIFNMYGRCGSLQTARKVFDDIPTKDIVSWNAIISLHANLGLLTETFHFFTKLLGEGRFSPNEITVVNVLGACTNKKDLLQGRLMHNYIQSSMLDLDVMAATSLINMYGKCSSIEDSWTVFSTMSERNVITWNAMIFQFDQSSHSQTAIELHSQMQYEGVLPDHLTFVSLFSACASKALLVEGDRLFTILLSSGLKLDVVVGNAVLNMYGKCGSLEGARKALEIIPDQNVITWTIIISAYTHNNRWKPALELYQLMHQSRVSPNQVTFLSVLDACANIKDLLIGMQIHAHTVEDGCDGDNYIRNSLISMYGKCGGLRDAQSLFLELEEQDVASWNGMIEAHILQGDMIEAFELFIRMLNRPVPPNAFTFVSLLNVCAYNVVLDGGRHIHNLVIEGGFESEAILGTALVGMYDSFSMLEDTQKVFNMIREQNVISWTAVITAYARHKQGTQAIKLFDQMQEKGIKANNITFISILSSLSNTEAWDEAEQMCNRILNCGSDSYTMVGNALIALYGKCGNMECARLAFDKMEERDLVSWNSMMAVYAEYGDLQETSLFLEQMVREGLTPDQVTFLSIVHACSGQLALIEGKRLHCHVIEMGYSKHSLLGTALISFYGKCGSVHDAFRIFNSMCKPDVISWTSMIVACAQNGRAEEAKQVFDQMQQQGVVPNGVTFSNIINACSHAGLFQDSLTYFTSMIETYGISPDLDHYMSIIDLLGRAGQIHQADGLISDMPLQPTIMPYTTLLGACRQPLDVWQGEQAAGHALELDPDISAPYVMLSNIHVTTNG